jgi:hypothetical protein
MPLKPSSAVFYAEIRGSLAPSLPPAPHRPSRLRPCSTSLPPPPEWSRIDKQQDSIAKSWQIVTKIGGNRECDCVAYEKMALILGRQRE